jgi:hypothetical protein
VYRAIQIVPLWAGVPSCFLSVSTSCVTSVTHRSFSERLCHRDFPVAVFWQFAPCVVCPYCIRVGVACQVYGFSVDGLTRVR